MPMGWNSSSSSESANGRGGDERRPDLVSTLVRVEGLKGEAEQLEKANKLTQAKAKLVEGMEMIITIRSTLTGSTDKACVDGILRGLIEEGERLQLLLRLDRLSHAWQQEKDSQPLTARSTSEPYQIASGKQGDDYDAANDKAMIDLIPTPPSDSIDDGIGGQKATEEKGEDVTQKGSVIEGTGEDVTQKGSVIQGTGEDVTQKGSVIEGTEDDVAQKEEGIQGTGEEEAAASKVIPEVHIEEASELKEDGDGIIEDGSLGEEEHDMNHLEHPLPTTGDVTLTDNSLLSANKGTVSFELSESEDGDNPSGIESSVYPTNTTRLSTISASILMEDDLGSIASYLTTMSPILLNPSGAPRSGGTRFWVERGAGDSSVVDLNNISYLKIGGRPCAEVASMIEGQREFLAPLSRGPPGLADVVVVMDDINDSFILRGAFEYFDKARLVNIKPSALPYSKEATVMLEVTNLTAQSLEGIEVRRGYEIVNANIKTVTGKSVPKGASPSTIIEITLPCMEEEEKEGGIPSDISIKVIGRAGNMAEGINCIHLYRPMVFANVVKGNRIKLEDDGITAVRRNGITNAVVFSKYPLKRLPISSSLPFGGFYYSITITKTATAMKTFALGLTTIDPSCVTNLPSGRLEEDAITTLAPTDVVSAASLLVGYDPVRLWLNGKSHPISSKDWRPAKQVSLGDRIGILFTFDKVNIYQNAHLRVQLPLDDDDACFMRNYLSNSWWAVVDVMGKVSAVKLNGDDSTPPPPPPPHQ